MEGKLLIKDGHLIKVGDIVFYMETKEVMKPLTIKSGVFFQNKFGHFHHDDFIGKELGSKIMSRSKPKNEKEGFITVVDFIPALWDKAGERLTQILYGPDISLILGLLDIRSDSLIVESGTGSGCLSINIANVFNKGHLYTFEFNKERATKLKQQFTELGLSDLITVTNQDVLEQGFSLNKDQIRESDLENYTSYLKTQGCFSEEKLDDRETLLNGLIDGVFIDLPSPWEVVERAKKKLKTNGNFVSFSPCMEQVEKTFEKLRELGFIRPRMFEICYRAYNYVKTEKVKIPLLGVKHDKDSNPIFSESEVLISSSRNDMRGHTGFLIHAVRGNN